MKKIIRKDSGQVLMIVLLIVLVATLAGLTLFARSLSESSAVISQEEKDKTFNRAEENASKYLSTDWTGLVGTTAFEDGRVTVSSADLSDGVSFDLTKNAVLGADATSGSVTVSWEECNIILVELWGGNDLVGYNVYHSLDGCGNLGNIIEGSGDNIYREEITSINGLYSTEITTGSIDKIRIKPLYADSRIGVSGDISDFYIIASEAVGDNDAEIRQRIEQDRSGDFLPEIFDYVLYSGDSIDK